jgi:hypothetical protein
MPQYLFETTRRQRLTQYLHKTDMVRRLGWRYTAIAGIDPPLVSAGTSTLLVILSPFPALSDVRVAGARYRKF